MNTRERMHLVDDEVHTFRRGPRTIDVRIRVWRRPHENAAVLVESAGARPQGLRTWAPRIGTYLHHVTFRGTRAFCYVERSGSYDDERWELVEFATVRHCYCDPVRRPISRAVMEDYIGGSV